MKKILYSVALAACCMGTMTSCSDFLDAEDKSNVSDKQTFATKDGFNTLVNDAYQRLQTSMQHLCSPAAFLQVQICIPMLETR